MQKKEIKKNIDYAVGVFREALEKLYLERNKPFYGVGIHSFTNFLSGICVINRKNSGALKISGEIQKEVFKDSCKGIPMNLDDYKIYPIVITLFQDDVGAENAKDNIQR